MTTRLDRLLRPRHLAVVGGAAAAAVIRQCDRIGYSGDIWPVHPSRDRLAGRPCYRTVSELPGVPDAVFIGVNRRATIDLVRELAALGAGGAVAYASGFKETEDGAALQAALTEGAGPMPVLGPNCYGFINYLDRALLWPDQHGGIAVERGVALVTQSSNVAISMTMQQRGLPIAYVVTAGNQAQTGLAEIAEALAMDDRVSAIGLHIEGIGDTRAFERMARTARERGVPVVALRVGRSAEARAAAFTHTASITGSQAGAEAFLRRMGVPWLRTIPEFLETLKLLHVIGPLSGRDICSLSCSGGEATLMADAIAGRHLRFRPLSDDQRARVRATLGELVTVSNPLDYHTFIWAQRAPMARAFTAMLDGRFDLALLVLDFPRRDRCADADWDAAVAALKHAVAETGAPAAVVSSLPENLPETRAGELMKFGIAPLCGFEEALAAAEAAASIGEAFATTRPAPILRVPDASARTAHEILFEAAAKRALAEFGLVTPAGRVVAGIDDAVAAAETIGYPVAVKVTGQAHKTEGGGVRLNLGDADAVRTAARALGAGDSPLLVERMVENAVAEVVIGVTRDAQFGLLMTIGAGGTLVELLDDTASLLLPATDEELCAALKSLRIAALLDGYRNRPAADVAAAVSAIGAVARYAQAHAETLQELDVNPLILRRRGHGAVAADALIVKRKQE